MGCNHEPIRIKALASIVRLAGNNIIFSMDLTGKTARFRHCSDPSACHCGIKPCCASCSRKHTPAKFKLAHRLPITEAITDLFAAPSSVTQESSEPAAQTAPPLPFAYIGKMVENGQAKVFLQEGETLYGIKLGEKLGTNYQVTSINNDQIKLLYLPLKITQIMSIGTRLD